MDYQGRGCRTRRREVSVSSLIRLRSVRSTRPGPPGTGARGRNSLAARAAAVPEPRCEVRVLAFGHAAVRPGSRRRGRARQRPAAAADDRRNGSCAGMVGGTRLQAPRRRQARVRHGRGLASLAYRSRLDLAGLPATAPRPAQSSIDAAGDRKRREQRAAHVLSVQRGAQARVRVVLAGARAVEKPEVQHHAAPPGHGEPGRPAVRRRVRSAR